MRAVAALPVFISLSLNDHPPPRFKSGRYEEGDDSLEYSMLTSLAVALITLSTVLFVFVLLYETRRSFAHFKQHSAQAQQQPDEVPRPFALRSASLPSRSHTTLSPMTGIRDWNRAHRGLTAASLFGGGLRA